MTIDEILAGESKNMEFKIRRPEKSIKYMKSVVAFANGKGGKIVFGIDDKTREVIGVSEDCVFQEIDAITNAISDSCEPTIIRMSICKILMEKQSLLQRLLRDDKNRITSKAKGWKMVFISVYQAQLD